MRSLINPFLVGVVVCLFPHAALAGPTIVFQNPCSGFGPVAARSADLNRDGNADLVVANFFSDSVSVLLGAGDATFSQPRDYPAPGQPIALAIGDVSGDGWPDILVAGQAQDNTELLIGLGNGDFAAPVTIGAGTASGALAIGDLNSDSVKDVAIADAARSRVVLLLSSGQGHFAPLGELILPERANPVAVALGDLDRDGHLDVATANRDARSVSIFLARSAGSFEERKDIAIAGHPSSVQIVEATGDSHADLLVADRESDIVAVFSGDGNGAFFVATHAVGSVPVKALARDLNGNTIPDLIIANSFSDTISILEGTGGGEFDAGSEIAAGTTPLDLVIADFNRDTKPDLLTVNFDDDDCSLLLNLSEYVPVSGDVDGDQRLREPDRTLLTAEIFDGDGQEATTTTSAIPPLDGRADANRDGVITAADWLAQAAEVGSKNSGRVTQIQQTRVNVTSRAAGPVFRALPSSGQHDVFVRAFSPPRQARGPRAP